MKLIGRLLMKIGGIDFSELRLILTGTLYGLEEENHQMLRKVLSKSNYIILTKRRWTISSWLILIGSYLLTGKKSYWTHALMNVEGDSGTVQLMEAVGKGVKISDFYEVFNCDAVTVLRPRIPEGISVSWEGLNDAAYSHLGKEYDSVADIMDDQMLNCTEYVWKCLRAVKDPAMDIYLHGLVAVFGDKKNLCPQMFYDCGSFEVVYEARK